jgi:hypothetical protein
MSQILHLFYRPVRFGAGTLLLFSLVTAGCNEQQVERMVSLRFDPTVSPVLQETVKRDIRSMANFDFEIGPSDPFRQVFGTEGSRSVIRYIDERINYVIGPEVSINEYVRTDSGGSGSSAAPRFHRQIAPASYGHAERPRILAQNIGIDLWLNQEAFGAGNMMFSLGGSAIPITSPRIGLFRIFPDYLTDFFIENISAIIHEARHSDCTGGLTDDLIQAVQAGEQSIPSQCGHLHSICPSSVQDYGGLAACDAFAWGAYSVQALWLDHVVNHCRNCRRRDQILANGILLDTLLRIPNYQRMVRGDFGPPNMSSAGTPLDRIRGALQDFRTRRQREVRPQ